MDSSIKEFAKKELSEEQQQKISSEEISKNRNVEEITIETITTPQNPENQSSKAKRKAKSKKNKSTTKIEDKIESPETISKEETNNSKNNVQNEIIQKNVSEDNKKGDAKDINLGFSAIFTFVSELINNFEKGNNKNKSNGPLLYHRLLERISKDEDTMRKEEIIKSFFIFTKRYQECIVESDLASIAQGEEKIYYKENERIFIPISTYIKNADNSTKFAIGKHLMVILAIFDPSKTNLAKLDSITKSSDSPFGFVDDTTQEGEFLSNVLHKAKKTLDNSNAKNPMEAITHLMGSGVIGELTNGIKNGTGKNLNAKKLAGVLKGAIDSLISNIPEDPENPDNQTTDES